MKPITKLYIKTFLLTGIPYGLIMTGIDIAAGSGFSLWKFLFLTFFFGVTMSIGMVTFHRYRLKKNGIRELTDENLKVSQTKDFKSKLNRQELIEKLKSDPIIGKMEMTEVENGILINSGMSWKSWGEEIKIILNSNRDEEFVYRVSSKPKLKMTLVDFGKSHSNINRIEKVIANIA